MATTAAERAPLYADVAALEIDTADGSPDDVAETVLAAMRERPGDHAQRNPATAS